MASPDEPGGWKPKEWKPQEWSLGQDWKPASWSAGAPTSDTSPTSVPPTPPATPTPKPPVAPAPTPAAPAKPHQSAPPKPASTTAKPASPAARKPEPPEAAAKPVSKTATQKPQPTQTARRPETPPPAPQPQQPRRPAPTRAPAGSDLPAYSDRVPTLPPPASGMPAHLSDADPDLDIPPSTWLPAPPTRIDTPFAPARKKTNPLGFVIAGIAIFFILGQLISSCTPTDPYEQLGIDAFPDDDDAAWIPDDEWAPTEPPFDYSDAPGPVEENGAILGPLWVPLPEGWENVQTVDENGREVLTMNPSNSVSTLVYAWEGFTEASDAQDSCAFALLDPAVGAEPALVDPPAILDEDTDIEVAACVGEPLDTFEDATFRGTAFLDIAESTSFVAASRDRENDPEVEAWDRYLTCYVGEQMGVTLEDCG